MHTSLPALRPGARLGVFSPSHAFEPDLLEQGMDVVRSWGYDLVPGPHLGRRHRNFAGTDEERLHDLVWALSAVDLDGAWMARGGSGLTRLLDRVPWHDVRNRPVVGFSDGTALHTALFQRTGIRSVHGPVLTSLAGLADAESKTVLQSLLSGTAPNVLEGRALIPGRAEGQLVGGNLTVLAALSGTPDQLVGAGRILLLEDIDEAAYRIDRSLYQLFASGALVGLRGVAVGSFVRCPVHDAGSMEAVFLEAFGALGVPVITGLPIGHGASNHAFVHGGACRIADGRLECHGLG